MNPSQVSGLEDSPGLSRFFLFLSKLAYNPPNTEHQHFTITPKKNPCCERWNAENIRSTQLQVSINFESPFECLANHRYAI